MWPGMVWALKSCFLNQGMIYSNWSLAKMVQNHSICLKARLFLCLGFYIIVGESPIIAPFLLVKLLSSSIWACIFDKHQIWTNSLYATHYSMHIRLLMLLWGEINLFACSEFYVRNYLIMRDEEKLCKLHLTLYMRSNLSHWHDVLQSFQTWLFILSILCAKVFSVTANTDFHVYWQWHIS